ncbi:hypothetical protein TNCV_4664301 [Trichonephila clavipes]|nr:hypothetical protein TNCV_4664301 [Trichonephila clavipes]
MLEVQATTKPRLKGLLPHQPKPALKRDVEQYVVLCHEDSVSPYMCIVVVEHTIRLSNEINIENSGHIRESCSKFLTVGTVFVS